MHGLRERQLVGLQALTATTELLQRNRAMHPTAGLFEAADLQWWWRTPRATDTVPQLVWFDDDDRPTAAVIATGWRDHVALDPLVLPDAGADQKAAIVERGLAHAAAHGLGPIGLEVDPTDDALLGVLASHGLERSDDAMVETWLDATACPRVSALHPHYRSTDRTATTAQPHHLAERNGPDVETRLRQTSLYRPELDLVVLDAAERVVAYGLFWFDPVTRTGLVEPMRTEDEHQRRGLARHVLTRGLDLLVQAGAERVKICYEPSNPASSTLYLSVGFEPVRCTEYYSRSG